MATNSETSKILSKEHKDILKIVDALESEIGQLKNKDINIIFFKKVIDFIRNYADKFHHAKEEDILFKEFNKYAEKECIHCNPLEQMLFEHEEGRKNIKIMESGLNEKNKNMLIDGATKYIQLIREHIFKEDNILYPMTDDLLSDSIKNKMLKNFKEIEKEKKKNIKVYLDFIKSIGRRK
ncbi:MAG: hemerythrin domain-containing protein [archaeon]|nr:hemerythrin domain-containing protein [archaeon]